MRDLSAALEHAGADKVVTVGHSFGAYIAARFAADHPGRVAGVVLADGGMPFLAMPHDADDHPCGEDPTAARMETPFSSTTEYLGLWRAHPAFRQAWNDDVEAYARYDMVEVGSEVRCVVSQDAVLADTFDLICDRVTRTAVGRVRAPVRLLCAPRGAYDDERPLVPPEKLHGFVASQPHVTVERVRDTNHYTLILGDGPGPAKVAATIDALVRSMAGSRRTSDEVAAPVGDLLEDELDVDEVELRYRAG
jgi:lipase